MPPPRTAASTCIGVAIGVAVWMPRTPSRRWAWSESRVSICDAGLGLDDARPARGAGVAGRRGAPNWALDLVDEAVVDGAGRRRRPAPRRVPRVEVVEERLALGRADRLLGADDVPAQRLVAEQQVVVDAVHVVARRVDVHVQLLDDHALLALDLLGVELRAQELVGEHVERERADARRRT